MGLPCEDRAQQVLESLLGPSGLSAATVYVGRGEGDRPILWAGRVVDVESRPASEDPTRLMGGPLEVDETLGR